MNLTYVLFGVIALLVLVIIILIGFIVIGGKSKDNFTNKERYTIENPYIG